MTTASALTNLEPQPIDGPAWLKKLKESSFKSFKQTGLPTKKHEDWKYLSLKNLKNTPFEGEAPSTTPPSLQLLSPTSISFHNGKLNSQNTNNDTDQGLQINSLSQALSQDPDGLKEFLENQNLQKDSFTSLNAALASDGAVVRAQGDNNPVVHIAFSALAEQASYAFNIHNIIIVEANSQLEIIESFDGERAQPYLTNTHTQIILKPGARLTHTQIQNEAAHSFYISNIDVVQEKDSHFVSQSYALGSELSRTHIQCHLNQPGAHACLKGIYLGHNQQQIAQHNRMDHHSAHSTSEMLFKGILDDASQGIFNGKVVVHPKANQVVSHQRNNNLLLSDQAEADPKPELEIYNDDVKCTHGATVGGLDENALFYLQARGIDKQTATHLLTDGFVGELTDAITNENLKSHILKLVSEKLQ